LKEGSLGLRPKNEIQKNVTSKLALRVFYLERAFAKQSRLTYQPRNKKPRGDDSQRRSVSHKETLQPSHLEAMIARELPVREQQFEFIY
jgi:hypothetical protein